MTASKSCVVGVIPGVRNEMSTHHNARWLGNLSMFPSIGFATLQEGFTVLLCFQNTR